MEFIRESTALKIFKAYDDEVEDETNYSFADILSALKVINAGRVVGTRGKKNPIPRSVLLNPYSHMVVFDVDNGSHVTYGLHFRHDINSRKTEGSIRQAVYNFVKHEHDSFANVLNGLTRMNLYTVIAEHKLNKHRGRKKHE